MTEPDVHDPTGASHLQEIHAELVSRQFPAGVSPAPGLGGSAPATDAALSSYIRANA